MKQLTLHIIFFLFCHTSLWAQTQVLASLDSTTMQLGSITQMRITAHLAPQATVIGIATQTLEQEKIGIYKEAAWDTLKADQVQKNIQLIAYDTGRVQIPPIPLIIQQAGSIDTLHTPTMFINIKPVQMDTLAIMPIKDIIAEPISWRDFIWFLIIPLLLLLLGFMLYKILTRQKKKAPRVLEKPIIIEPAHLIATRKLELLKEKKLWQQGQVKEYYSELTYILREYFENRYQINALENTSDEILEQLQQRDMNSTLSQKVRQLLHTADLVKFAKSVPTIEMHEQLFADTSTFIDQTKALPEPTTTNQEKPS